MNRFTIARNLVLLGTLALGGCFAQGNGPEDVGQTGSESRHEVVGADNTANVARSQPNLAISHTSPLGADVQGPQPEPWNGDSEDGDNGGPQPEPWKPLRIAPDHSDDNASAPK
jgi:hypothetical protein